MVVGDKDCIYKAAFDTSTAAHALVSFEWEWVEINTAFSDMAGYLKEELVQKNFRDVIILNQSDLDTFKEMEGGDVQIRNHAVKLVHADGGLQGMLMTASFVKGCSDISPCLLIQLEKPGVTDNKLIKASGSEQVLWSLFEQNSDAVFSLDLHGRFTSVNNAAMELAECSREELLGKSFDRFLSSKGRDIVYSHFLQAQKGISFNFETPIVTASGFKRYLNITNMPVVMGGEISGIFCIAKDITDRKNTEEQKALGNTLSEIFHNDVSLESCLYAALKEICLYLGCSVGEAWVSSEEIERLKLYAVYADQQKETLLYKKIRLASGMGLAWEAFKAREMVFSGNQNAGSALLAIGSYFRQTLRSGVAIPLFYNQKIICVLTFFGVQPSISSHSVQGVINLHAQLSGDISKKKKEEELDRFFSLTSDMFCVIESDGYLKKINDAFSHSLGYSRKEILAQPFFELILEEDRLLTRQKIKSLVFDNQRVQIKNRCVSRNGQYVWIEWVFTSLISEGLIYASGRDITESRKLEKAIEAEKQRFSKMIDEAPVTMCILKGPRQIFVKANDLYCKFSGREDLIGRGVRDVFPEAEGQGIFELMEMVYQTGKTYSIQERLVQLDVCGNGKLDDFYLSFMFQPYTNSEGEVEGIFYFGVDVTEQVLARRKIEESKRRYVDLIQNLPVAVYTCNVQGNIQLFNKAAITLWGRIPDKKKHLWCGSWKILDVNDVLIPHRFSPMAIAIKESRHIEGVEMKIERPNGEVRNVVPFPSPMYDADGTLSGGMNVLIDITDRKKAEEELNRLSLIAKKTINAVLVMNPDGYIEWANEGFMKVTGFLLNEVVGKRKEELLYGEKTDPESLKFIRENMQKQRPFECELLQYTKGGDLFWVEIQAQPMFNSKGVLTHYFELETDITGRKTNYEKLLKKEQEVRTFARQLNVVLEEERSRIAREIHDEFGQQLTGLKMSLSALNHVSGNDERIFQIVNDMMEGVEESIRTLRNFSTELRPGILDTLGLVPSIEWLAREFQKKTSIFCEVRVKLLKYIFEKDLSITFFRICQEALTNISKHAEASKVIIEIGLTGKKLRLKILDNGKGIKTEKLEDPFSLGLIGMRERANLIGARLMISSGKSKGTCVQIIAKLNE